MEYISFAVIYSYGCGSLKLISCVRGISLISQHVGQSSFIKWGGV